MTIEWLNLDNSHPVPQFSALSSGRQMPALDVRILRRFACPCLVIYTEKHILFLSKSLT